MEARVLRRGATSAVSTTIAMLSLAAGSLRGQSPCGAEARASIANGWSSYRSGEIPAARTSFERARSLCTTSGDAIIGLAYVDLREGDVRSARSRLEAVLSTDPTRPDAIVGMATVEGREGHLIESERLWSAAVEARPRDTEARAGLVRVLRWQGRHKAALAVLVDAGVDVHTPPLAAEHEILLRMARPSTRSSLTVESDSDGNRMYTASVTARWSPRPDVTLRIDSYARRTSLGNAPTRHASGHALTTAWTVDPGWSVTSTLGGSAGNVLGLGVSPNLVVAVSSPARHRARGTLRYARQPMDYTSPMIERSVDRHAWVLEGVVGLSPRWRVLGSGALGRYEGQFSNGHWDGRVALEDRREGGLRAGLALRSFGFESDVTDGYYDPRAYFLAEVPIAWTRGGPMRSVSLRFAPGVQHTPAAGVGASIRTEAVLLREWRPGRGLRASAGYASSGAGRLTSASGDYRYVSATLALTWVF